jgi:catechol 2,3-dioxygenase-like lactoylglutathione lyase family enzyme
VTRPPLVGIRHVALFVRDLEAAEQFWTGVMGYEVEWRPDPDNVYLHGGRDNLAIHRAEAAGGGRAEAAGDGRAEAVGDGRLDHIGLAVPTPDAVDAWAQHLEGQGVAVEKPPRTHRDGSRSLYFRGPEGLLIQIIHHLPMLGP